MKFLMSVILLLAVCGCNTNSEFGDRTFLYDTQGKAYLVEHTIYAAFNIYRFPEGDIKEGPCKCYENYPNWTADSVATDCEIQDTFYRNIFRKMCNRGRYDWVKGLTGLDCSHWMEE